MASLELASLAGDGKLFTRSPPSEQIMARVEKEIQRSSRIMKKIANAISNWKIVTDDDELYNGLKSLRHQVTSFLARLVGQDFDSLRVIEKGLTQSGAHEIFDKNTEIERAYNRLVEPYVSCKVDFLDDDDSLIKSWTFNERTTPKNARWPLRLDSSTSDDVELVKVHNSGMSKGCGNIILGDDDDDAIGCREKNYEDNVEVTPGSTKDLPGDLEDDVCGLWVTLKYIDQPVE